MRRTPIIGVNCLYFGHAYIRIQKKTPKVLKPPFCILLSSAANSADPAELN